MSKNKIFSIQLNTKAGLSKTLTTPTTKKNLSRQKNATINLVSPKTAKNNISQDKIKNEKSYSLAKQTQKLSTPSQNSRLLYASNPKGDDILLEIQNKIRQLNEKLQKMYAYIDLFNLINYDDQKTIRCLQHNNVLTLYCINERKILCVNCTYGITKHRTHKVLPLRDCIHYVTQDNDLLSDILHRDIKFLQESHNHSQQNMFLLQKQYKKHLEQLDYDFKKRLESLTLKYQTDKKKIEQSYEKLIKKSQQITEGIDTFKHNFWETLSKIQMGKDANLDPADALIMKQVFRVNLSEFTHFQVKKITNRQIQRLGFKIRS